MRFTSTILVSVCLVFAVLIAGAHAHEPTIKIEYDDVSFQTRLRVSEHEGRFYWADVLRAVARAKGWEDRELAGLLPSGSVKASSLSAQAAIAAMDRVARPHMRIAIVDGADPTSPDELEVTLDRAAMLATRRRFKKSMRQLLTPHRSHDEYGLHFEGDWEKLPRDTRVVVVLHGWNSRSKRFGPFVEILNDAGHVTAVCDYPNDQPIADSALRISAELKHIAKERPDLRFAIIAHSMGGLVAREVIENAELDPKNIEQLVMVATPNQGSQLARIAFAFDLWQYAAEVGERGPVRSFFASIEDGLAEASRDLRPDSVFLVTLNRRKLNPDVRYSLLLGSKSLLSEENWAAAQREVNAATSRHRFTRIFGPKLAGTLADMDEVVDGLGDGAVSIKRGKLAGVDDVVVLPFLHTDLADNPQRARASGLFKEINDRL